MKIVLLPSSFLRDLTYSRVLSSLKREFSAAGHRAVIARSAAEARRLAVTGACVNFHFSGWLRPWHAPFLLSLPHEVPLTVTFQDYRHPDLPPLSPAGRRDLRRILSRAGRVTAVSRFLARMIREDFPAAAAKLRVIHNGTDPQGPGRPGGKHIITVGRPAPYKGLDLLLFSFSEAVRRGCKADLLVCGAAAAPLRGLAKKLGIGGKVRFSGKVAAKKLAGMMGGSLFYAAAPRWESFGMAALEAMASGRAVLATRTGGMPEFAVNGLNAVLVPPQDTSAISDGILRLCGSAALREKLGRNGRITAARLSWKKAASSYLRAYPLPRARRGSR